LNIYGILSILSFLLAVFLEDAKIAVNSIQSSLFN